MREHEVEDALRAMGRVSVPPEAPSPKRRELVLDAMVQAAGPPARRSKRPIAIAIAAALAAALFGSALVLRPSRAPIAASTKPAIASAHRLSGEVIVLDARGVSPAPSAGAAGAALGAGDRVATLDAGRATVHLAEIAAATLSPDSELVIGAAPTECAVRVGTVAFDVAALGAGTFVVHTPEADVTVHGTSFRVSVGRSDGDAAPRTEVTVSSGVVVVHPRVGDDARLVAGDRWPAAAAPLPAAVTSSTTDQPRRGAQTGAPSSELAEQNRLLAEANAAGKRGDPAAEARALDSFVQRFPKSPGAHDAVAARMRAAVRSGDASAARAAAQRYLSLFPDGPLRDEALAARGKTP
jgi:hypothetical protein